MGTAFFRTGTCISRLDNFDHVRTTRVWNWHVFFLWTKFRSGLVRANVISILFDWRKGTLSIHGFAWVLQSRGMTEKEVVGSWLIRRTWVRPSSPAVCRRSMEEPLKLFSTRPRCYMLLNPILSVIKVCHFFLLLCPDEYLDITIWVLCHMGECIICLLYSDCCTTIVYDLDGIWVDVVF